MSKLKRVEVRCQHCNKWFDSGIKFPEDYAFDAGAFVGMLQACPLCGENTHFTRQNMRIRGPRDDVG